MPKVSLFSLNLNASSCVAALLLLALAACGGEETPSEPEEQFTPRVTEVTVTPSSAKLTAVDDTQEFEARAEDQRGNEMGGVHFRWGSSDTSVARVDSGGTAVARGNGTVDITARARGVADTALLQVNPEVAELQVSPDTVILDPEGDTAHISANALDENGNPVEEADPHWSVSDTSVATVDTTGVVTARREGKTVVVASLSEMADSARVSVEQSVTSSGAPTPVSRTLPSRFYAAGVWDPQNERILVHGGSDRRTYGNLWSYDPRSGEWRMVGDGPPRWGHQAVWDPAKERMIIFGGNDGTAGHSTRNDVHIWDASTGAWSHADAAGSKPRTLEQPGVAYAPSRKAMYVFGGMYRNKTDVTDELWLYHVDSNRWEELQPSGSIPEARKGHSMIWDAQGERLLMYGGWNSSDPRHEDLWEYDPAENQWREISTGGEPPRRYRHGVAWDSDERHMYIFAGCCGPDGKKNDLWRYDAEAHRWSRLEPEGPAPAGRNRLNDQMFWDPVHEAVVVYAGRGGCPLLNDLWAYVPRSNKWKKLSVGGAESPLRRTDHASAELDGKIYLFGGCDGERQTGDLVRLDPESGEAVVLEPSGESPPGRSKHGLAAAPSRGELYLYGGMSAERAGLRDIWVYDVSENRWSERPESGSGPVARFDPAWVWNPEAGEFLLFGGVNQLLGDSQSDRFLDDLWSYDPAGGGWEELEPRGNGTGPSARKNQKGMWDSSSGRMLIYGGHSQRDDGEKVNYTDLWGYQPESGSWTQLDDGEDGPAHRVDLGAAWNPGTERMLMFGGITFSGAAEERIRDDFWRYDLPADSWQELTADGPGPRQLHELVWVDGLERVFLVGGYGGKNGAYLGSVWRYAPDAESWSRIR